jgi:hypothetical protein
MHSRARGSARAEAKLRLLASRTPSSAFVFARVCATTPLARLIVSDSSNAQRVPGHRNRECFAPALLVFHCVRRSVRSAFAATRVPVSAGPRLAGSVGGGDDVDGVRAFRAGTGLISRATRPGTSRGALTGHRRMACALLGSSAALPAKRRTTRKRPRFRRGRSATTAPVLGLGSSVMNRRPAI